MKNDYYTVEFKPYNSRKGYTEIGNFDTLKEARKKCLEIAEKEKNRVLDTYGVVREIKYMVSIDEQEYDGYHKSFYSLAEDGETLLSISNY